MDGTIAAPGQIVRIADSARAGKRQGGRIHSATTTVVTVDAAPTVAVGDSLTCTMPTGVTETHTVSAVSGNDITVGSAFSVAPETESAWVVESSTLAAQTFRVISVLEDGQGPDLSFTITALAHNASKFDNIDTGAPLTIPNVTAIPPSSQPGPATVTLSSAAVAGQVLASTLLTVQWDATPDAIYYEVDWQKDNGDWLSMGRQYGLSADISHVIPGAYVARVRAVNGSGIGSVPTVSAAYTVADQTLAPGFVADLGADAAAAQAAADAANAALADIASDNLLTPGEKPVVIRDTNVITTEQAGIDAQATAYAITTQKTAYDTAVSALTSYLATLTAPVLWSNLTGNTTIVGATFRQKFADVYTTRQALLNAIYAAAKSKADTAKAAADAAQATANTAAANAPAVINGQFKDGTAGWTFDSPPGFYQETGANSPDSACNTYLVRQGQAGTPTTVARNQGYVAVQPGQTVTAAACLKSLSANAGAFARVRISWRDANHTELSVTQADVTVGPGGTYLQAVSRAVGQAPANAQFAHFEIIYSSHTSGYFSTTSCNMALQVAGLGEVPDGGGYIRGIVSSTSETVDNSDFEASTSLPPPGWVASGATLTYLTSTNAYSGSQSLSVNASAQYGNATSTKRYPAAPGDQFLISGYTVAHTGTANIVLAFFDKTGAFISGDGPSNSVFGWVFGSKQVTAPAGSVYALILLQNTGASGGDAWFDQIRLSRIRSLDTEVADGPTYGRTSQADLYSSGGVNRVGLRISGSGQRLGDMRNQVMVGVGNYGAGWSGGSITYSATTTSATITAAASNLRLGSSSLSYSASSVTVSGSAGTTATYYLYYDDDGYTGGAKTLNATTSQLTTISADGRVLVGTVAVTFPTSGTGGGSGGQGCPVRTARVVRRTLGGEEEIAAGAVAVGDRLKIIDPVTGATRWGLVTMSRPAYVDCVRVVQQGGVALSCSVTAPLGCSDGVATLAPDSLGRPVTGLDAGALTRGEIVHVASIGKCWVQHITCEDDFFLAGDQPGRYLAHHNLKPLNP